MPWFITVYLIGAVAAVILSATGHSKKNETFIMAGVIIGFICGLVLGFGAFGSKTGAGAYAYYVNGVRVASGIMVFFEAFAIAIIFGAFPNLFGLLIANMPGYFTKTGSGKASKGMKLICIFLIVEGILGLITALIMAIIRKSFSAAITGVISSSTFLAIGLLLKKKYDIR